MLPPPADAAAKPAAPSALGGGLGGGANPFGASSLGGGLGGGVGGSANPFALGGGSSSLLGGAPTAAAAGGKKGVFWEAWPRPEERRGFSARHFAKSTDRQRKKSDVVLLQQPGSATQTPRYSVLCDGVEWVVAEGEHNAWEAIVLFLLQRAKRDGVLGGLDLKRELYTPFMAAMSHEVRLRARVRARADPHPNPNPNPQPKPQP